MKIKNKSTIKIQIQYLFFFLLGIAWFSSCDKEDVIPTKIQEVKSEKTSSVLLYIIADNDLSQDAIHNMDKVEEGMKRSKSEGDIYIYYDGESGSLDNPPLLLRVSNSESVGYKKDTVKVYPEANSASKERFDLVLSDYVNKTKAIDRKGLILWSHGSGWLPACFPNCEVQTRSFGEDLSEDKYGKIPVAYSMEIKDLVDAIPQNTFEYIIFDACLMQCVEVAYQLRHKTNYILGGTSLLPAVGHPYQLFIPLLLQENIDYVNIAQTVFNSYALNERENGGASYSLVETKELEKLAFVMNKIMKKYKLEEIHNKWSTRKIQGFDYAYGDPIFYDLIHYVHSFASQDDLTDLQMQLDKTVLFKNSTKTILSGGRSSKWPRYITVNFYSGLSMNRFGNDDIKKMGINAAYKELDWYKDVYL